MYSEVEQREHEASQSHQSAPTVSSAPPPPPPPPPPPTPTPHHPPAASGSAQHAPTASTTGPASLPPRPPAPAPGLPDVNAPCPVAPVQHPPPALDSSYHRSAARPPEPRPVPMSREPPRAPQGMLIPLRGHWEPPRVQEWRHDSLAPLWDNRSQRDRDRATEQAGSSRGLSESLSTSSWKAILSVSMETYSVEDTTMSTMLSVPTTTLPVMDSAKTMALPISTKTIPVARSSWAAITAKSRAFSSLFASPTQLGAGVSFDSLSGRTIV
ncbi:hypothetical protein BS47DRAFT_1394713 [Hydnum rufescens UP504]|uniref:Uncharacterized protein n=1 Tax=Hydnum rufescens UP504 TaxID=1448309 RepID=A0A9P6ATV3_9AGAM|nr:hypothetical protein BS47DRAFT_1394713 [Hydnum rufescens UP504]